ncbi:MAG: molybdopterin molybdotransferase MoeA [Bacteroidales bacterium]|nr:molybdopterin molybdotransferase MoeA [Bacteroidales bacterium]
MISLGEAIQHSIDAAFFLTDTEKIYFTDSLNRILAEDIIADIDIPSFNKSAMDGYALRKEDINHPLTILQVVQAGDNPIRELPPQHCVKIMTGARIPDNANYVAKIEDTYIDENGFVRIKHIENKSNIRFKAEDTKKGDVILNKGCLIRAQEIATLATLGKTVVSVHQTPTVSIASTGNELVEPHNIPTDYQIRNSNAYQIIAQCLQMKINPLYDGIIPDNETITSEQIQQLTEKSDVVILTGGVSMGDFDFIPHAIRKIGFDIIFQSIAVQPGKPTLMAQKDKKTIFGLPGNPVSSFLQFELIVKPFLFKLMGHNYRPIELYLPLAQTYHRKKAERTSLVPVKIHDRSVIPVEYHGSAHLFSLNDASGFIIIPSGITSIESGTYVNVRLFSS